MSMGLGQRAALVTAMLLTLSLATGPARVEAAEEAAVSSGTVSATESSDPVAHDPTMIKQGQYYYEIITGDAETRTYLPIRRSTDLVNWTYLGTVFTTPPAWLVAELGITPDDFWAPDLNYFDGEYHLYYAASSFGTNNSVIGLTTNVTLDPSSPDYQWVDQGMVFRSSTTDTFNAIDPDVVFDNDGVPWMSFGSFWDGVKMRQLDVATGLLSTADTTLYSIASRGGAAIEGPSIVRHGGYYYLFVSLDYCCRGVNSDYRVAVGRSTSVTGPYVDAEGTSMLAGGGTELLRGYNDFQGPGGGDVFVQGQTALYVHHYYDAEDEGDPKGSVRTISWKDGWPVLGDPLSGNRGFGRGSVYFTVVNRGNGTVLEDANCGYESALVQLSGRVSDNPCQQWRIEDRGEGYSSILNQYSNKVAEVASCLDTEGAQVAQWGWYYNDCQRFRVVATDGGWSRVENKLSGRVLGVTSCDSDTAVASVQMFTWDGDECQQFRLDPVGDVLIASATNDQLLDVSQCDARRSAVAVANSRRAGDCQLWNFVPVDSASGDAYYTIVNKHSGRPLTVSSDSLTGDRISLGAQGAVDAAQQWRIEAVNDGSYLLINRNGDVLQLGGGTVSAEASDGDSAERVLLLAP